MPEQEYNYLTVSNMRSSTLYSATLPNALHQEPGRKVGKHCADVFGILPRFLERFLESENLVCGATAGTENTLAIIHPWFYYFMTPFFKALSIQFLKS